jgi:hypothetical protein
MSNSSLLCLLLFLKASDYFVFGLWSLVFGLWSLVFGLWSLVFGFFLQFYDFYKS